MPRSGIAGSYGSSIFRFLRNLQTILYSGCTNLQPTVSEGCLFSNPTPAFIVYRHFKDAILTRVRWYLTVALISISLIISNVEHLFICVLAICISSLQKGLFRFSA